MSCLYDQWRGKMTTDERVNEFVRVARTFGDEHFANSLIAEIRRQAHKIAEDQILLCESRQWQSEGEFGAPLEPEFWTSEYADYMARLEAAIGEEWK